MEQLSFFEKLEVLFQNILAHPFFICILLLPVFIILFNKKITKKAIILVYIAVLLIILFIGNTIIFSLFDNFVDGIFMALYFPNFITLFVVEVASAIICLITFLKKDITKVSKIINITGFSIIQTIFALILTVIEANDIDIYQENALYASNDILTLMQLLMGTFALQIITLLVVHGIEKVTAKLDGTNKDILNKHVVKLPAGSITHVNLKDKIIISNTQSTKEPNSTPSKTPVEYLNNIQEKPIENKVKPIITKETTEILTGIKENPFDNFTPKFSNPVEPKTVTKEKQEEKELITNLQIVDFEKMVEAIKNLSIIYTM